MMRSIITLVAVFAAASLEIQARPDACPSVSAVQGTVAEPVQGAGATQQAAYLDMISSGVDSGTVTASTVVCDQPCHLEANQSLGTAKNIQYIAVRTPEGAILSWVCTANWTGRFTTICVP